MEMEHMWQADGREERQRGMGHHRRQRKSLGASSPDLISASGFSGAARRTSPALPCLPCPALPCPACMASPDETRRWDDSHRSERDHRAPRGDQSGSDYRIRIILGLLDLGGAWCVAWRGVNLILLGATHNSPRQRQISFSCIFLPK